MSTLRISNIEAKADSSSPTVDEQLRFTNSDGDLMLYLDGRTAGITTVGINTTNQTIKFDANNNVMVTGIITATEFHGTLAVGTSVTYGDNEKAYFGDGQDLQLVHTGTYSNIYNATGDLDISSNVIRLKNGNRSETFAAFINNGQAELYYDNSRKFATSNTGVSVTGAIASSGNLSISNVAPKIFLTDTDTNSDFAIRNMHGVFGIHDSTNSADRLVIDSDGDVIIGTTSWQYKKPLNVQGSSGHILSLYNGDTGTYAADTMSGIEFKLLTGNTGNQFGSCEIRAFKENGTNGDNARALSFYTGVNGGSPNERLRITSDGNIGFNRTNVNAGDSATQTATATPARFVFNNHYSNGYTDASLKLYLFNDGATRQGFTSGPLYDLQYHSSGHATHAKHSFFTQNVERLRITSAGFVQIGAAADAAEAPLHVTAENSQGINAIFGAKDFVVSNNYNYADANIALQGRDADDNDTGAGIQFTVRNTANTNWLHGAITMDVSGNYIFKNGGAGTTVGTEKLRITSGGKVNIGGDYTNTTSTLRVIGDSNAGSQTYLEKSSGSTNNTYNSVLTLSSRSTGSAAANYGPGITFQHAFGGANYAGCLITSQCNSDVNTADLVFYPRNYGFTEALRIGSNGKVGINQSDPGGSGLDITTSRTTNFSTTTDQRSLANLVLRQSSDAPNRFVSLSFVNGGGTQAEASINLVQTGNYEGDFRFKFRAGGGSTDWRQRFNFKSSGLLGVNCNPNRSIHVSQEYQGTSGVAAFENNNSNNNSAVMFMSTLRDGNSGESFLQCNRDQDNNGQGVKAVFFIRTNGDCDSDTNSYGGISDIKLKENIVDAKSQWDDIKNIKVRNFNFKDNPSQKMLGVVAQEVETVSAGLVKDCPDENLTSPGPEGTSTKSVKYSILYMKAIKALQEAQARIETLEAKVSALEGS